jgi:hypothetical protein
MPRIRSLHPGQWTDADFCKLKPIARLLCLGLRNIADDHGVFIWDPYEIKIALLPVDNADIPVLLRDLYRTGTVLKFRCDGRFYGQLRNFITYQKPQKPKYAHPWPKVAQEFAVKDTSRNGFSNKTPGEGQDNTEGSAGGGNTVPVQDEVDPQGAGASGNTGIRPQISKKESKKESKNPLTPKGQEVHGEGGSIDRLPTLQELWPHDRNRGRDRGAWQLAEMSVDDPSVIVDAARKHVTAWADLGRPTDKVPALSRWLTDRRWLETAIGKGETVARPVARSGPVARLAMFARNGGAWPAGWGPVPDDGVVFAAWADYRAAVVAFSKREISWDENLYGTERPDTAEIDAAVAGNRPAGS